MKLKKLKEKKSFKDRTNLMLFLLFCAFTLSLTVGYAALNEELKVSGEASFRVQEDIRITDVSLSETTNLGIENYSSKYGKNSITLGVKLNQLNSTVKYSVQIVNSGSVTMWIDSITQETNNNPNIEYVLEGIVTKQLIKPGDVKNFNLVIKYKEGITLPSNINLDTILKFNFIRPTSTLAQGNSQDSTGTFFNGNLSKESIETIEFSPVLEAGENAIGYWDASENHDQTVIAWYMDSNNNGLYELYISGIGEVNFPEISTNLFSEFTELKSINFGSYVNTSDVTNMAYMFYNCSSLTNLDLSKFITSNVTDMSFMFYNCNSLTSLDIRNFDFSSVALNEDMFYDINSDVIIYVKDNPEKTYVENQNSNLNVQIPDLEES